MNRLDRQAQLVISESNIEGVSLRHSQDLHLGQEGDSGLYLVEIDTPQLYALVSLQGAQILCFKNKTTEQDLFWLSPQTRMQEGKAIRGGVPLCLPWFGVNRHEKIPLNHGFARVSQWQLLSIAHEDNNELTLAFQLPSSEEHLSLFPVELDVKFYLRLGRDCRMQLRVENLGGAAVPFSWAMHSYHPVPDITQTHILGLSGIEYLDNTQSLKRSQQVGDIQFTGELDRVYLNVPEKQYIQAQEHIIQVSSQDAKSAIVWNPGEILATGMSDIGASHFSSFVCLERGAAFDNELTLQPGQAIDAEVNVCFVNSIV